MPDHNYFANLIWQIADLLRGPYRPPQYERDLLPMTVLCRFHNHSPLDFEKLKGDPNHIARETDKLNSVRVATERTAALFKERRAAVTGQIEVEAAA